MNTFIFYNDTNKEVRVHPATEMHGCTWDMSVIEHLEERIFHLPAGTIPWVKMWDYGDYLSILVSPKTATAKE